MRKIILSSMGLLSSCVPNPDPEKNTKLHFLKQILKNVQRSCDCDIVPPSYVLICLFSIQKYVDRELIIIFAFQTPKKGQDSPFLNIYNIQGKSRSSLLRLFANQPSGLQGLQRMQIVCWRGCSTLGSVQYTPCVPMSTVSSF